MILCGVIMGAIVFTCGSAVVLSMIRPGDDSNTTITGKAAITAWVRANVADPEAKVRAISAIYPVGKLRFKKARISARNAMGGYVMNEMVFEFGPAPGNFLSTEWTDELLLSHMKIQQKELSPEAFKQCQAEMKALLEAPMLEL